MAFQVFRREFDVPKNLPQQTASDVLPGRNGNKGIVNFSAHVPNLSGCKSAGTIFEETGALLESQETDAGASEP